MSSHQPTLKEIARELRINVSTVSRALQNHPSIGHRTRERVHALADQKGYVPNTAAVGLRTQRKYLIGVVVPTVDLGGVANWVNQTTQALFERGYLAIICQWAHPRNQPEAVIRALLSQRVDGVLLCGAASETLAHMAGELAGKAMPYLCIDLAHASTQQATSTQSLLALIEG